MSDIHIHVHASPDPRIEELLELARASTERETLIMSDLSAINTALDTLTTEVSEASAQLEELAQAVRDLSDDPAERAAIADRISNLSTSLDEATRNTDVVSPPTPEPEPEPTPEPTP